MTLGLLKLKGISCLSKTINFRFFNRFVWFEKLFRKGPATSVNLPFVKNKKTLQTPLLKKNNNCFNFFNKNKGIVGLSKYKYNSIGMEVLSNLDSSINTQSVLDKKLNVRDDH